MKDANAERAAPSPRERVDSMGTISRGPPPPGDQLQMQRRQSEDEAARAAPRDRNEVSTSGTSCAMGTADACVDVHRR